MNIKENMLYNTQQREIIIPYIIAADGKRDPEHFERILLTAVLQVTGGIYLPAIETILRENDGWMGLLAVPIVTIPFDVLQEDANKFIRKRDELTAYLPQTGKQEYPNIVVFCGTNSIFSTARRFGIEYNCVTNLCRLERTGFPISKANLAESPIILPLILPAGTMSLN